GAHTTFDRAVQRGTQLLETLDVLTACPERLSELVVARRQQLAGDAAAGAEERILLMAHVTPSGVVRHDDDDGQFVPHRRVDLHGGEAERSVAGEEEYR